MRNHYVRRLLIMGAAALFVLSSCRSNIFHPSDTDNTGADDYCTLEWSTCKLFTENKLAVKQNDLWGYINPSGETVIDFQFQDAAAFAHGIAMVKTGTTYNIINSTGELIMDVGVTALYRDVDDAIFAYQEGTKYGLLRENGTRITEPIFDDFNGEFSEDLLAVKVGTTIGYASKTGSLTIPATYEEAYVFTQGLGLVRLGGLFGFVNPSGQLTIPATYTDAYSFDENDRAIVEKSNGKFSLIDKAGTEVIVDMIDIYQQGPLYEVEVSAGQHYIYKPDGTRFNEQMYSYLSLFGPYIGNIAGMDGETSFDDYVIFKTDGTVARRVPYSTGDWFVSATNIPYLSEKTDVFTLYSATTSYVLPGVDDLEMFTDEYLVVKDTNDKIGLMTLSTTPQLVIPFEYDNLTVLPDDFILGRKAGLVGILNLAGTVIVPLAFSDFNFLASL